MKKSNLWEGILFILGGLLFLWIGLAWDSAWDSVWDSIVVGMAVGGISGGIVMTVKYFYWSRPGNRERYQQKIAEERIELRDELKEKLRNQAGRYAYIAGLLVVSVSIFSFSVLGKVGAVANARLMILYLSAYLIFQIAAGKIIFRRLLRKYE